MKKSIEEQIIERILSNPYEVVKELAEFSCIYDEDVKDFDELNLFLIKNCKILLSFLKNEKVELLDSNKVQKILNKLRKLLVQKINNISKNGENFYELTILLLALDSCSTTGNAIFENNKGLVKNDKVLFCYDLAMLIVDYGRKELQKKWFNQDLKKLRFN